MKKKFRLVFKTFAWVIGIFLVLWLVVWAYVILNKKSLIKSVTTEIDSKIKGIITIGDLEPSLLSTFPNVSLRLSDVLVRDSLWKVHHHDLLKAKNIIIRLKFFSLFSGSPAISKVIIENGSAYIFSDTTGFTNGYMFSPKNGPVKKSTTKISLPDIELRKMRLVLDQKDRGKFYDLEVDRLASYVAAADDSFQFDIYLDTHVHSLAFNTGNGSFVKEKRLQGKLKLNFDRVKQTLSFSNVKFEIDDHPFTFSGRFDFTSKPMLYYLTIKTENVDYSKASALLSSNISSKLDSFNIEKPFSAVAILDGTTLPNRIPRVSIDVSVKNNIVTIPLGVVTDASFNGNFSNHLVASEQPVDKNSGFTFTGFTGKWENIALRSDTVRITNLEHPVLDIDLHSSFKMEALNDLLGTSSIEFKNGNCQADIRYHGLVVEGDAEGASIFGNIGFDGGAISYLPRNLSLSDCSGKIIFQDKDVYVKQLKAQVASSQLLMNGGIKNLTSLIDNNPEKLILNWNLVSPRLNLEDFMSFLNTRASTASKKTSKRKLLKLAGRIDRMLNDCNVALQVNADRLTYKKFDATGVAANLRLTDKLVSLNNVRVQHAGGSLSLNGSLQENGPTNSVHLTSKMENVDVAKVLNAFNNFGQDGITDKNLKGRLSADINISGVISSKAEVDPASIKGVVDLNIKNGQLIDFEPVKKISQTAFKNRDFSNIRFAELKEKLEVNGTEVKVNRMEIQSTAFTMFVEGIYDVKKGTDLSIQIPLSNLAKRDSSYELKNKGVKSKTGVSIRLRAKTAEDGSAKISWDPFKRALSKSSRNLTDSSGFLDDRRNRVKRKKDRQ